MGVDKLDLLLSREFLFAFLSAYVMHDLYVYVLIMQRSLMNVLWHVAPISFYCLSTKDTDLVTV